MNALETAPANLAEVFRRTRATSAHAWMKSEQGPASKITLQHFAGGRDAKYLVAVSEPNRQNSAQRLALSEWLWPTEKLASTEIVYDCTEEILHGKAKPILCDLSQRAVRVFALLPTQVETIQLSSSPQSKLGESLPIRVEFGDASGNRLAGVLPFHLSLLPPAGQPFDLSFQATEINGVYETQLVIPKDAPSGKWKLQVRSQLNGLTKMLQVSVAAARE